MFQRFIYLHWTSSFLFCLVWKKLGKFSYLQQDFFHHERNLIKTSIHVFDWTFYFLLLLYALKTLNFHYTTIFPLLFLSLSWCVYVTSIYSYDCKIIFTNLIWNDFLLLNFSHIISFEIFFKYNFAVIWSILSKKKIMKNYSSKQSFRYAFNVEIFKDMHFAWIPGRWG